MKKSYKDAFMYALGGLSLICAFVLTVMMFFHAIPEDSKDILYMGYGQFLAIMLLVYNYFYSSSKGSSDKTDIMSNGNGTK